MEKQHPKNIGWVSKTPLSQTVCFPPDFFTHTYSKVSFWQNELEVNIGL